MFPAFAMNLLSFVGLYGTALAHIGAIIVVDVLLAWIIPVGAGMYAYKYHGVFASYLPLPCAIACGLLYIAFSKMQAASAPA